MKNKSLKGYAFEYLIRRLMLNSGFTNSPLDNKYKTVYTNGTGTMIHGLGQPHNADVLMDPPIQTPFYYQSRLLVECKAYSTPLGLGHARNVLGLREDINSFNIVDLATLTNRRNYSDKAILHDFEKFQYQVALASLSGFKAGTVAFAHTHRIPLIDLDSLPLMREIKDFILDLDLLDLPEEQMKELITVFQGKQDWWNLSIIQNDRYRHIINFFEHEIFSNRIEVGITNTGDILFLYKMSNDDLQKINNQIYEDGFSIHWNNFNSYWYLRDRNEGYIFQLPEALKQKWIEYSNVPEQNIYSGAITLKEKSIAKIIKYYIEDGKQNIKILHLSKRFIEEASL